MSHLLAIAVGPVQEFIAAARRTRDLWFGSYLLSEISRAVAKSVEADGGKLIFPASSDAENVANVILAELPSGEPRDVADKAEQAAKDCWESFANTARKVAGGAIDNNIWEQQIDDVIEFYAAWVLHSDPKSYPDDRKKLMRLLAGRKNCRDFPPHKFNDVGIPKSSLDGQRPSVFVQPKYHSQRDDLRATWPKLLRLASGEQLDVVGVTKRLGKKPGESHPSYSSVARVAAETWLRGVRSKTAFEELNRACEAVRGLNKVAESYYQYFPFEGTVIYKDRHTDLQKELGLEATDLKPVAEALKKLGGEPNPYLAVLIADGDSMGKRLSQIESAPLHREFSTKLATFAAQAKMIVESEDHRGVLIYAGGDDVIAFLPVHTALLCARSLQDDFYKTSGMTLSVGIAIGHFMENLEDLLEYGRAAEKAAKKVVDGNDPTKTKDALAVHLHKRGGSPIKIASRWETQPEVRLHEFAKLMNDGIIPTKLPYELRAMAKLYESWTENADAAIQQDLYRLIAKKTSRGSGTVRQALSEFINEMNSDKLMTLARELLIARQIATALRQAAGRSVAAEEVTS
jgi:CRISPR-associated protein Cmr2